MTENRHAAHGSPPRWDLGVIVALAVGILAGLLIRSWWLSILVGLITAALIEVARHARNRHRTRTRRHLGAAPEAQGSRR